MNTLIKAIAALAAVISLNVSAFASDDDFSGKTMCVFGDSYVANHLAFKGGRANGHEIHQFRTKRQLDSF